MKKLALSLCFIAVSAAYVWQHKPWTLDQSQADAELLGDPAAPTGTHEPVTPGRASPAVLHVPILTNETALHPISIIKVASATGSGYADGVFTGPAVNAYYGIVQVQAIVKDGRLARIKMLQYPSDRQTSIAINRQALPMLRDEVIAAQSANVDIISGATLTSEAFRKSLSGALNQAH